VTTATVRRADTPDSFRLIVDIPEASLDAVPSLGAIERATQAYVAALAEVGVATDSALKPRPSIRDRSGVLFGVLFGVLAFVVGLLILVTLIGLGTWAAVSVWGQVL
jgi:hypothetical protein